MKTSASWEVRIISEVVSRDGSVTGKNIINMRQEFKIDPRRMTSKELRMRFRGAEMPPGES